MTWALAALITAVGCSNEDLLPPEAARALPCADVVEPAVLPEINTKWLCSVSADIAQDHDLLVGDQVRVRNTATGQLALYTIGAIDEFDDDGTIRMTSSGRKRLGSTASFCGEVESKLAPANLSIAEATVAGEFVEELIHASDSNTLILAPHGGRIERGSDTLAENIRAAWPGQTPPSSWICRGWANSSFNAGAYDPWHVSSTDINRRSFPGLDAISDHEFERVVSVHGHGGPGGSCGLADDVVVGGGAPEELLEDLRGAVAATLASNQDWNMYTVADAADSGGGCGGSSARNIVNSLSVCGGVQLELSYGIRVDAAANQAVAATIAAQLSAWDGCGAS